MDSSRRIAGSASSGISFIARDHNGTQRTQNPDEAVPPQHFRGDIDTAPESAYSDDTTADDPSPYLDDSTADDPSPNDHLTDGMVSVEPADHVEPNMIDIPPREAESMPLLRRNLPRSRNPPARLNLSSIISSDESENLSACHTSDGSGRTKDKVKARLVGGGDGQDRNHYTRADTSSPTVSITAIFIIPQLAAALLLIT